VRGRTHRLWVSGFLLALLGCQTNPPSATERNRAAVETPPVVSAEELPRVAQVPIAPGKTTSLKKVVKWQSPSDLPLWYTDPAKWRAEDPARQFTPIGIGEGADESQARRNAYDDAVAKAHVPADQLNIAESLIREYTDGSWEVEEIYQVTKPAPPKPCSEAVGKLCDDLLHRLKADKAEHLERITVGRFVYKNTPFVSEFSEFLAGQMQVDLQGRTSTPVMGLLQATNGDAAAASEIANGPQAPSGGPSRALIWGSFWPSASDARVVHVQVRMDETSSRLLLSAADADLALGDLSVQVEPPDSEKAQGTLNVLEDLRQKVMINPDGRQNFKLSLWLDGAKQVWKKGEKLVVHIRSERDCNLNLFDVASDGSVQLLFPNQRHPACEIKGGREYAIPDETMGFDFIIGEPFGVDIIVAVATTGETSALYAFRPEQDANLRSIEEGVRGIVVKQKDALAKLPGDEKAAAGITFTTVP
jgi:hypothetical protein